MATSLYAPEIRKLAKRLESGEVCIGDFLRARLPPAFVEVPEGIGIDRETEEAFLDLYQAVYRGFETCENVTCDLIKDKLELLFIRVFLRDLPTGVIARIGT
jgi:hypothetical protein